MTDETRPQIIDEIEREINYDYHGGSIDGVKQYTDSEDPDYDLYIRGPFAALHRALITVCDDPDWTVAYLTYADDCDPCVHLALDYVGSPEGTMFTEELIGE